jgi:hypothetical protein
LATLGRQASSAVTSGRPLDMRLVASNFAAITRSNLPVVENSRYNQPYDNMNLLEKYNGRALDMDTEIFTAEMLNERGMKVLAMLAPVMFTTEHHVTISSREYFMLPYDLAAIGGVPRRTFFQKEQRTISMQHYIRYQAMELNHLLDVNFGRQMLDETLALIVAQARLTLCLQFAYTVTVVAVEQSFKRFQDDSRSARQIYDQTSFFALANANPDDLALRLSQVRDQRHPYNMLLIPENTGRHVREVAHESRSVDGYHYGYDAETERFVVAVFTAQEGVAAMKTADGAYMAIVENVAYRYSNTGRQRMRPTQTLEGYSTLCEVVLQPEMDPDTEYTASDAGMFDPVVHDQTETMLVHNPLVFAKGLAACNLWNNRNDGSFNSVGFSDTLTGLLKKYNESTNKTITNFKKLLVEGPKGGYTPDNNTPGNDAWENKALSAMDFRDAFRFVTVDSAGRFVAPKYILSLPEIALSDAHVAKIVRFLTAEYKKVKDDVSVENFMASVLPDGAVITADSKSTDGGAEETIVNPGLYRIRLAGLYATCLDALTAYVTVLSDKADDIKSLGEPSDRKPALDLIRGQTNRVTKIQEAIRAHISELKGRAFKKEELLRGTNILNGAITDELLAIEEFKKAATEVSKSLAPALTWDVSFITAEEGKLKAAARIIQGGTLLTEIDDEDAESPLFKSYLAHVPDSHVDRFSTAFAAMTRELDAARGKANFAQVNRGADAVLQALRSTSGKTSSRAVVDNFATHLGSGKSVADFANGSVRLMTTLDKSLERPLPATELKSATKAHRSQAVDDNDAMDIDAPVTFKGRNTATFGARDPDVFAKKYGKGDMKSYPVLERRINAFKGSGNEDYDHILAIFAIAKFSYVNVYALAKRYGIQLFRMNYWRPFQQYRMYHMIAMVAGPQTMVTGFASPIVHPSMSGMEGYINIVAQFFSAVIVAQPDNVCLIPNAICQGLLADINTEFVRTLGEIKSAAPHKPSTMAEVVPLDETKYQFPLHMLNQDCFHPNDPNAKSPFSKHSGAPLLEEFATPQYLSSVFATSVTADPMTRLPMSLIGHRSWAMYPKANGVHTIVPGTGPRAKSSFNAIESADVWAGNAVRFPSVPHYTKHAV